MKTGTKHARLTVLLSGLLLASTAHAFNYGGLSDPFGWMSGNNYNDNYGGSYGGYGNRGYGGYGYDSPGYGGSGYPGFGGSGYPGFGGSGNSGYSGYGSGYPGYGAPAYGPPPGAQAAEIERLKARIRKLEQADSHQAPSTFNNPAGQAFTPYRGPVEHQWPVPNGGFQPGYQGTVPPVDGKPGNPVYQPDYGIAPRYRFQ